MNANDPQQWAKYLVTVILLHVLCLAVVHQSDATGNEVSSRVTDILADDSIRYEDKQAALLGLGADAVPSLAEQLLIVNRMEQFIIIGVLREIEDQRATPALLSVLSLDNQHSVLPALVAIADPRSESTLMEIMTSSEEDVGSRLLAAQGLVRIGEEPARSKAVAFILDKEALKIAHEKTQRENNWNFPYDEWEDALIEVGTPEAFTYVLNHLKPEFGSTTRAQTDTVRKLAMIEDPCDVVVDGLIAAAEGNHLDMHIQLMAIDALIGLGGRVPKERLLQIIELARAHAEDMGPNYVDWLERLKAKTLELK